MKAGFIGLGTMGASMATNLQKGIQKDGHSLIVHDIRKESASPHIKNGAIWADTPAKLAAECDIIFSSLPGPAEFESVSFGLNGLLAGIKSDAAYFVGSRCSTRWAIKRSILVRSALARSRSSCTIATTTSR